VRSVRFSNFQYLLSFQFLSFRSAEVRTISFTSTQDKEAYFFLATFQQNQADEAPLMMII